ncbi:ATP-binding cassette domain-containing protein [Massilia terrae]|uniref:Sn-glycerol-3-phosphate ABC transporter ATP-binding protein UgpC n=1 Tax=Massilia terrae TaxID=1811224 RepID=A0ABT2D4K8_9BURK|nr:sn-glycerol-3-phosphate ABC transporter ATP-binding protein UgpC [Massilia terrae]MCS0661182.1 sn-glycerol-3-phosphate ABC transporter ATP-binding protein UgpC [Massilia terrae]
MAELVFEGISKHYGKGPDVLRDINLSIAQGEFCVFIGPSGCGKSTLLRMVAGLEDISRGELRIGGARVNEKAPSERGLAMVFQSYALYPHMTVYQNLAFGLKVNKAGRAEIERKVRAAAEALQLVPLLERLPRELSGGQRQRVAIGRAIVREPRVFLFDEPLSNLDAELRANTRLEIARLHADLPASTMIYVTHDQVEAMTLADKIVLLNTGDAVQRDGSVAQCGAPLDLYHYPANRFVAGFIGTPKMNFIDAELEAANAQVATVRTHGAAFQARVDVEGAPKGTRLTLGIRPEHARLGGTAGLANTLGGTVAFVEQLGESSCVHVRLAGGELFTVREREGACHRVGDQVSIWCEAARIHAFREDGRSYPRSARADANGLRPAAARA